VAQSDEQQRVDALLGLEEIFGRDLPHNALFVAGIPPPGISWRRTVPARPLPAR
jgi:hypothetical protein